MSKKTILKVIAAICVMSLCFAAVFTGAVSAESATCTVKGYSYSPGAVDVYVGYEVTFTSNTAFTAGSFQITSHENLRFVDCIAKVSSIDGYVPKVYLNVGNDKVLFAGFTESATNDIHTFSSLTLVLKFTPTTAIKDSEANTKWPITIGNISITNAAEATYTCNPVTATGANRAHVHNFTNANTSGGVTTKTCDICGAVDKTVDVSSLTLGSNTLASTRKANLTFAADGDTVLNALVAKDTVDALGGTTYFTYKYKDDGADYKNATTTATGTVKLNGDNTVYYVFPCGRNGGIGRMSRNITGNFINVNGNNSTISGEWSYSIKQYIDTLITSGTDAQKNYAKALWNFAYYTTYRLVHGDNPQATFQADLDSYTGGVKDVADWPDFSTQATTPAYDTAGSWSIKGVKAETGYKPKLHIRFDTAGDVTVQVTNSAGDLVYKKTLQNVSVGSYFVVTDLPTKYLTGTLKVSMAGSNRKGTYGFGNYAKARQGKSDGDVFKWMMNYAYYLGQVYA